MDALIPIPNKVEVCSKGRTYSIDKKSAIKTTLAHDSHCIKELQKSIEKHTGAAVTVSEKGDLPKFGNWGMPATTLEQTYALEPGYNLPAGEQSHIIGIMGTLWAEAILRVPFEIFQR